MPNHNSKIPEMISCLFWPFIFYLSLWHLQTFLIYALKQGRLNSIIDLRAKQCSKNETQIKMKSWQKEKLLSICCWSHA